MGIKSKKRGNLSKKHDRIEIFVKVKEVGRLGELTMTGKRVIYDNFADVKRLNIYRLAQYGFEATAEAYEIFINPIVDDFKDAIVMYEGRELKIQTIGNTDDNLGQKLKIVANYGG